MTMVGGDRGKGKEHRPHPKKNDTFKSDGKKSGRHGNTEKSTEVAKRDGCYICCRPHGYTRFPKLKILGAIYPTREEREGCTIARAKCGDDAVGFCRTMQSHHETGRETKRI